MRRCLILAAVLVLAAACTGGQAATTSVTTSTPPTTTSTTTTSTTTTSTLPVTTTMAPLPEGTWHKVLHDYDIFGAGGGDQTIWSVTTWEHGLVAVGESSNGINAAAWFSADGITWGRAPHNDPAFGGLGFQQMRSVTSFEGRLFAVGQDGSRGYAEAAVWTSEDGISWERVPHNEEVFGGHGDQVMRSVTAWAGGLAAAGTDHSGDNDDAAIWTSTDGITWERVPHDDFIFGGFLYQGISSIVAWNDGLVAVGTDQIAGDEDAVVWISSDGVTWEWAPHDEEVFGGDEDQGMTSVAAWSGRLVAVGYDTSGGDLDAVVWVSSDGITWERVPQDEDAFGGDGDQYMSSVAVWDSGLVAVGYASSGQDRDAAVWFSTDALHWERTSDDESALGDDQDQALWSVVGWNDGLVAVGEEQVGWNYLSAAMDAAVWYWTPD